MAQKFVRSVDNIQDISKVKLEYHDENDLFQTKSGEVYILVDKGQGKELAKIYPISQTSFPQAYMAILTEKDVDQFSFSLRFYVTDLNTFDEVSNLVVGKKLKIEIYVDKENTFITKEFIIESENLYFDEDTKVLSIDFNFENNTEKPTSENYSVWASYIIENLSSGNLNTIFTGQLA